MKKFWVGLLSVMVLVGGCLLSACGQSSASITLSDTYKEICLNADTEEPIATVTAEVFGIPDGSVTVSSSYENIVRATVTYNSATNKNIISIYGISEGHADILVSSNYQSSVSSSISVDVYSVVTDMEQIEEDTQNDKSNLFAVRGDTVTLEKEKLITFTPAKSRKNITWSLPEGASHASFVQIENDKLTIDAAYPDATLTLVATADTGVSTEIVLSVLDKINEDSFQMTYAYSTAQNFNALAGETIQIVPNISADPQYIGYIKFAFSGQEGLEIVPQIKLGSKDSKDIQISRESVLPGEDGGSVYLYQVRAANQSVNNTFDVHFFVGYDQFNYSVNSESFKVASYEKINKINVYNQDGSSAAASAQSIYTSYAFAYGTEFKVELLPTTVVNATGRYMVQVDYSSCNASDLIANDVNAETLEFYYKTPNGSFVKLQMKASHESDTLFESDDANLPNSASIYALANGDFIHTSLLNVRVTFIAADNTQVQAPCIFNLYKSASQLEFTGDDTNVSLATSSLNTITKTFTLNGQSTIEGLFVETKGLGFDASEIVYITSTADSVTFSVTFRMTAQGLGLTENGSYQIRHKNGIQSAKYPVRLFLPLENAQVIYDAASSTVTRYSNAADLYLVREGGLERVDQNTISVNDMMVKANSTVPLSFLTNIVNGHSAEAIHSFAFLDLTALQEVDATMTEEAFRLLEANQIYTHVGKSERSGVVHVSNESIVTTGQIGLTYMLVTFTGTDIDGNEVQFVRIVLIENYVAPSEFVVTPSSALEIYAFDSVASKDNALTKQTIKIAFSNTPITYTGIDCFHFSSYRMGNPTTKTEQIISWADGYFNITDITVSGTHLQFTVNGLTTKGVQNFVDNLTVTYHSNKGDNVTLSAVLSIKIMNATRIEKLVWENESPDGLYFEVGDKDPLVIVTSYQPNSVKNDDLTYFVTDTAGNVANFVMVQPLEGKGQVLLRATQGAAGYIYIIPSDAINAGNISYYDQSLQNEDGTDQVGTLLSSRLGQIKQGQQTWYDYLCENAYFLNNQGQKVLFSSFLVRINITVADGSSPEFAYNLYSANDFATIDPSKYYRVMNNVTLSNWKGLDENGAFTGGLFGKNKNVRITLRDSNAFVQVNQGEIYDLTFAGNVTGSGFVANINEGLIRNVTVDVDIVTKEKDGVSYTAYQSSVLNGQTIAFDATEIVGEQTYVYVGGITGVNKGQLADVHVLGATIIGSFTNSNNPNVVGFVGGIAGKNWAEEGSVATILNARFEIYNFEKQVENGASAKAANTLTGNFVGGLVGYMVGGSITNSYIYDYAAAGSTQSNLIAMNTDGTVASGEIGKGAFIGKLENATIVSSFAMVNVKAMFDGDDLSNFNNIELESAYTSYYQSADTFATRIFEKTKLVSGSQFGGLNQDVWMIESSLGFNKNVNGGYPYFKNNYQAEALSSVDEFTVTDIESGDLYHSLQVGDNDAILFNYAVSSTDQAGMTSSELLALEQLNTISIAKLFGISDELASRLVIASTDASILAIDGANIIIRKTGTVSITLSSKQDFTLTKTFNLQIVNALTTMNASWSYLNGSETIEDNATVNLQRGKSLTVTYGFAYTSLYLGNSGNQFALLQNDYTLVWDKTVIQTNDPVTGNFAGKHVLTLTSSDTSKDTPVQTYVSLTDVKQATYQAKIKSTFRKSFHLALFNGAISLGLSNNEIGITPSTVGVTTAQLLSSSESDDLIPTVALKNGDVTIELTLKSDKSPYIFSFGDIEERIQISVQKTRSETPNADGIYTYDFNLYFEVTENYRGLISDTEKYEITLTSKTQVVSQSFTLSVTKQSFTNIDIANYRIKGTSYERKPGDSEAFVTMYQTSNETTGVISPGVNSLLRVNVNPQYAYYKYFTIEYSGAPIVGAATIKYMKTEDQLKFYEDDTSEINPITNGLQVMPSQANQQYLYFKIWASDSNKEDTTLTFTIKFYDGKNTEPVTFAKYYLSISYLSEPQVLVDGKVSSSLAKGMTSEVKVVVDYDSSIDISTATLENVESGISLGSTWVEDQDARLGQKTYTNTLSASVKAKLKADANSRFYVTVAVSRIVNGNLETKNAKAEVTLVDFKINADAISVKDATEPDTFITYLGVPQVLQFDYPILPESYTYDKSDTESAAAVSALEKARESFANYGYYPNDSSGSAENGQYFINYNPDYDPQNPSAGENKPTSLGSRLFYYSSVTQNWNGVESANGDMSSVGGYLEFVGGSNSGSSISIKGLKLTNNSSPIQLRMDTIVRIGDMKTVYSYFFNVQVRAYSDEPDLPLIVRDAEGFMGMSSGDDQDYILMDDIVLSNYTPFATDSIRSLDGNGHTIYIESFNLAPANTSSLDLALFTTVNSKTTLKNLRVNLYNGGQIVADVSQYTTVNVAGLAITNNGTITNSEVVSFSNANASKITNKLSGDTGIQITYIKGAGTSTPVYLTEASNWNSNVAGFVIENTGNITNSRVGGDTILEIGTEKSPGIYNASTIKIKNFMIRGQGNLAGFVLNNSGAVASSFAKNIGLNNESDSTSYYTSGFMGVNNGRVITSYVEGVQEDSPSDKYCRQGSTVTSKLGVIAGYVYQNKGMIQDAYANILISNSAIGYTSYLASGFVYQNEGTIINGYSASQITSLRYSQMNFSGVDASGNLLSTMGSYVNCYYYSSKNSSDDTTESSYNTGATRLATVTSEDYFYGFSFTSVKSDDDGIWKLTTTGPVLTEPNFIATTNRYYLVTDETKGTYALPYSVLVTDLNKKIDTSIGSRANPIIIRSAQEYVDVTGKSTSVYISNRFTKTQIKGNYRLVNDIDFSDLLTSEEETTVDLPSTQKTLTGSLFGNGFTMNNLSIASNNASFAYGLFASVENATVINLNVSVTQVVNNQAALVGAVAGLVKNSKLTNVSISFKEGAVVEGLNFVGGVTGMVFGDSVIKNITATSPNVLADRYVNNGIPGEEGMPVGNVDNIHTIATLSAYRQSDLRLFINQQVGDVFIMEVNPSILSGVSNKISNYSYAGGLFGMVDIFNSEEQNMTSYAHPTATLKVQDYDLSRLRVYESAMVKGQVAGGLIGYSGYNTNVKDAGLELNAPQSTSNSHIVATRYYAGGIVGQSYGYMAQLYSIYTKALQDNIENNLRNYYQSSDSVERGATDIFEPASESEVYDRLYIGGLLGYVGSGHLNTSYSKINVISTSAAYAGGIVGNVNSGNASGYYINDGTDNLLTNYAINEVYASGDVRGAKAAGGIIGQLQDGTMAKLHTVNAVNMISYFNYQTKQNYTAQELMVVEGQVPEYNFAKANVYALLGAFGDTINGTEREWSVTEKTTALELVQIQKVSEEENAGSLEPKPSVGVVKSLTTSVVGNVGLNLYPGSQIILQESNSEFVKKVQTFIIPSISNYHSAASGYEDTFGVFLGSDLWPADHWYHQQETLYPTIKFSVAQESYVFLDNYNIQETLNIMKQNPSIEVRVRGLVADNSDECKDVDLRRALTEDQNKIENYRGKLVGNQATVNIAGDPHWGQDVGIVLTGPMFKSVAAGFRMQNLQIYYTQAGVEDAYKGIFKENTSSDEGVKGAFINSTVSEAVISNINIDVIGNVYLGNANSNGPVGFIAPEMTNTNISSVVMTFTGGSAGTAITVNGATDFGLIAGKAIQKSATKTMNISSVSVYENADNPDRFIWINSGSGDNNVVDVGGLFGELKRVKETENNNQPETLKFTGCDFFHVKDKTEQNKTPTDAKVRFVINNIGTGNTTLNWGGMIGNVDDVTEVSLSTGNANFINVELEVGDSSAGQTKTISYAGINAGGLFGSVSGSTKVSLVKNNEEKSEINVGISAIKNETENNKYNLGGFIGKLTSNVSTDIQNISVNLDVFEPADNRHQATSSGNAADIKTNYIDKNSPKEGENSVDYIFYPVVTNGTVNVGGYVGYTSADLNISSSNEVKINSGYDAIAVQANAVNAGSIVGFADYSSRKTLSVTGKILSQALFSISKYENTGNTAAATSTENDLKVGGIIGSINAPAGAMITIGDNNHLIGYNGQIFSNAPNAILGGIVGYAKLSPNILIDGKDNQMTVLRTVFGGAFKIHGEGSQGGDLVIGGTFGKIENPTSDSATSGSAMNSLLVKSNYNYGDVLVLYNDNDKFTSLYGMTFGGLVGRMPDGKIKGDAFQDNYSLVTYNNQRLLMPKDSTTGVTETNVKALFGTGYSASDSTSISQTNFYSHDVCLATDNFGVDAGYMTNYALSQTKTGGGYNTNYYVNTTLTPEAINKNGLASIIKAVVQELDDNATKRGTKLNPLLMTSNGVPTNEEIANEESKGECFRSNGVIYFYLGNHITINNEERIANSLNDTAIIGDGFSITMPDADNSTAYLSSILEMKGLSIVSGVVVHVGFDEDSIAAGEGKFTQADIDNKNANVGGLVGTMNGGIIYAVSVQGTMSYGGTGAANVGGIVGKMNRGLIAESNTALDILYRAGNGGYVAAIANAGIISQETSTVNKIFITNTYATGSVETYISANISAFTMNQCVVRNSYTIAKLIYNDYTTDTPSSAGKLHVFDYATSANYVGSNLANTFYYDQNATEFVAKKGSDNREQGTTLTTSRFKTNLIDEGGNTKDFQYLGASKGWLRDEAINFGYPTRHFNYMKLSSYAKQETVNIATPSEKDRGIVKHQYTRLSVTEMFEKQLNDKGRLQWIEEKDLQAGNYYRLVPHAGLFMEMTENKYVLMYHIDLQGTEYNKAFTSWSGDNAFSGILDGNDKSIKNIKGAKGIFDKVTGTSAATTQIRNLNIYTTLSGSGSYGALVNTAENATFSNITINGTLSGGAASIGGLIGTVTKGVDIDNVVSLAAITASTDAGNIGGIVGIAGNGTQINYSSNYGTIRSGGGNAGGLVGSATGTLTVQNSYNTNSVLVNYTGNSSTNGNKSGGLVGSMSTGTISKSYNTGIVKAGNKSNTSLSYAGGIVAYGSGAVTITNCLNEGSIEALGENADYSIAKSSSTFTIKANETTEKNVNAFGIGCLESGDIVTSNNTGDVENNGIQITNYQRIINAGGRTFGQEIGKEWKESFTGYTNDPLLSSNWYSYASNFGSTVEAAIKITSKDKYGFPTSFYIPYTINLEGWYTASWLGVSITLRHSVQSYFSWSSFNTSINSEKSTPAEAWLNGYYGESEVSGHGTFGNVGGTAKAADETLELDKASLTQPTEALTNVKQQVSINGLKYLLTNGTLDSITAAMQSNMFIYTGTLSVGDLPVKDKNYYTITVKDLDKISYIEIESIKDGNITIKIYATKELTDSEIKCMELDVRYKQTKKVDIDLSNLNYSYNEEGTVKIYLTEDEAKAIPSNADSFNFTKNGISMINGYNTGYKVELSTSEGEKTVYLIFNSQDNTLSYYKDMQWSNDTVNTDPLKPKDFATKELMLYYSQSIKKSIKLEGINTNKKVTGKVTLPNEYTKTGTTGNSVNLGGQSTIGTEGIVASGKVMHNTTLDTFSNILNRDSSVQSKIDWYSNIGFKFKVVADPGMLFGSIEATDEDGNKINLLSFADPDGWSLNASSVFVDGHQFTVVWDEVNSELIFTYSEESEMNEEGYEKLVDLIPSSLIVSDMTMIQLTYQIDTPTVRTENYDKFNYDYIVDCGSEPISFYQYGAGNVKEKIASYDGTQWVIHKSTITVAGVQISVTGNGKNLNLSNPHVTNKNAILSELEFCSMLYDDFAIEIDLGNNPPSDYDVILWFTNEAGQKIEIGTYSGENGTWYDLNSDFDVAPLFTAARGNYKAYASNGGNGVLKVHIKDVDVADTGSLGTTLQASYKNMPIGIDLSKNENYQRIIINELAAFDGTWKLGGKTEFSIVIDGTIYVAKLSVVGSRLNLTFESEISYEIYTSLLGKIKDLTYYYQNKDTDNVSFTHKVNVVEDVAENGQDYEFYLTYLLDNTTITGGNTDKFTGTLDKDTGNFAVNLDYSKVDAFTLNGVTLYTGTYRYTGLEMNYVLDTFSGKLNNQNGETSYYEYELIKGNETISQEGEFISGGFATIEKTKVAQNQSVEFRYKIYNSSVTAKLGSIVDGTSFGSKDLAVGEIRLILSDKNSSQAEDYRGILEMQIGNNGTNIDLNKYTYTYNSLDLYYEYINGQNEIVWYNKSNKNNTETKNPIAKFDLNTGKYTYFYNVTQKEIPTSPSSNDEFTEVWINNTTNCIGKELYYKPYYGYYKSGEKPERVELEDRFTETAHTTEITEGTDANGNVITNTVNVTSTTYYCIDPVTKEKHYILNVKDSKMGVGEKSVTVRSYYQLNYYDSIITEPEENQNNDRDYVYDISGNVFTANVFKNIDVLVKKVKYHSASDDVTIYLDYSDSCYSENAFIYDINKEAVLDLPETIDQSYKSYLYYKTENKTYKLNTTEMNNVSTDIGFDISTDANFTFKGAYNNDLNINKDMFRIDGSKLIFDYKYDENNALNVKVDISNGLTYKNTDNRGEIKLKPQEAVYQGVIFTRNLCFGEENVSNITSDICGNDYYMMYFSDKQTHFINNLGSESNKGSNYLRDFNILAQLQANDEINNVFGIINYNYARLSGIQVFGSIRSVAAENKKVAGVILNNYAPINKLNSYVSINGLNAEDGKSPGANGSSVSSQISGIIFSNSTSEGNLTDLKMSGTLIAGNGGSGMHGMDGADGDATEATPTIAGYLCGIPIIYYAYHFEGGNGSAGGNAGAGGNICTIIWKNSDETQIGDPAWFNGVAKAGDAGINGRGGNGGNGYDLIGLNFFTSLAKNAPVLDKYKSGLSGLNGGGNGAVAGESILKQATIDNSVIQNNDSGKIGYAARYNSFGGNGGRGGISHGFVKESKLGFLTTYGSYGETTLALGKYGNANRITSKTLTNLNSDTLFAYYFKSWNGLKILPELHINVYDGTEESEIWKNEFKYSNLYARN